MLTSSPSVNASGDAKSKYSVIRTDELFTGRNEDEQLVEDSTKLKAKENDTRLFNPSTDETVNHEEFCFVFLLA
jgi:hypothetical protein